MTKQQASLLVLCMAAGLWILAAGANGVAKAADATVALGEGGYAVELPPGAKRPQAEIYKTADLSGPMPTNDWWSSLAWMPFSERQYPHPLAVQAESGGLRIYYPGPRITANKAAIFGFMPAGSRRRPGPGPLGRGRVPRRPGPGLQRLVRPRVVRPRRVRHGCLLRPRLAAGLRPVSRRIGEAHLRRAADGVVRFPAESRPGDHDPRQALRAVRRHGVDLVRIGRQDAHQQLRRKALFLAGPVAERFGRDAPVLPTLRLCPRGRYQGRLAIRPADQQRDDHVHLHHQGLRRQRVGHALRAVSAPVAQLAAATVRLPLRFGARHDEAGRRHFVRHADGLSRRAAGVARCVGPGCVEQGHHRPPVGQDAARPDDRPGDPSSASRA